MSKKIFPNGRILTGFEGGSRLSARNVRNQSGPTSNALRTCGAVREIFELEELFGVPP